MPIEPSKLRRNAGLTSTDQRQLATADKIIQANRDGKLAVEDDGLNNDDGIDGPEIEAE
jgi:hypothetical protein